MAHIHKVYDTDGHYIIDANTRLLKNASTARVTLVQRDHNSERITFELERFVDGHDMSLCNSVRINYTNKGASGSAEGCYLVSDLQISPDDESVVVFSWLVSQHSTQYEGPLTFSIRFICSSDGSTVDYAWSTVAYAGLVVSKGLNHDGADDVYVYDSLQGWIDEASNCVALAKEAAATAQSVKDSIPEDYTALSEDIGKCIKASSIVVNSSARFVAPYNDMNTLPVGQVVTYIGKAYYPANLPSGFNAKTEVFTVITFNYNNAKFGGSVQVIYAADTCYWRTASTETAYSAWVTVETPARLDAHLTAYKRETIRGYIALNSADKFVPPYTDLNTFPVGSVVTCIGGAYYPANLPNQFNCASGLFTVMTFNHSNNWSGGTVQILYTPETVYYRFRITETAYEKWVTLYDAAKLLDAENLMPLFETVGIVGDSYSSGAVSVNGVVADHYAISWGQIMARRNGITCTNFSAGGLTTRTWLTHSRGAALLQSESAKKLYILALGINDNALLKADYLGTAADIKMSDYTKNPDTFYGNYGRIIAMIKEKAPNAKIVISTMAPSAPGNYVAAYNAAIEEIAGLMGIPLLVQGDDHYFVSDLYKNNIVNNHPLASGYAHMAAAFERMICKAMNNNQDYFADYVG